MATITISLTAEEHQRLQDLAKEAKVPPEELARVSVVEWLSGPRDDFAKAAKYVLQKNAELYRRLA